MRNQIACGWLILLAACNGTRTGNPGDDANNVGDDAGFDFGSVGSEGGGRCKAERSPLASLDARSPLGLSAADVLAVAGGTHQTEITWHEEAGPETGTRTLELRIEPSGAAPQFVTYTDAPQTGNNTLDDTDIGLPSASCEGLNQIEVEVDVAIESEDGALDEHVKGLLRARSASWATLHIALDAEDLDGSLQVMEKSGSFDLELRHVNIYVGFAPIGLRGNVSGDLRATDASVSMGGDLAGGLARGGSFAEIGGGGCLDGALRIGLDQRLQDFDAQDAIDRVNDAGDAELHWQDDSTAPISLELAQPDMVCAVVDPSYLDEETSPGFVRIHATLSAQSDGQAIDIDAHWPVVVEAKPASDGTLGDIAIAFDDARRPFTVTDVEAVFGIAGIDTAGFDDAGFDLTLQMPGGSAEDLTGWLTVSGIKHAMCEAPPDDPADDGMTSPGCRGDDLTQLAQATIASE